MSDLVRFRDYARALADGGHCDDCPTRRTPPLGTRRWVWPSRPVCPGCVSDTDRDLWGRLADEVDDHLATVTAAAKGYSDDGLFGSDDPEEIT